jgi:hypothetical protein
MLVASTGAYSQSMTNNPLAGEWDVSIPLYEDEKQSWIFFDDIIFFANHEMNRFGACYYKYDRKIIKISESWDGYEYFFYQFHGPDLYLYPADEIDEDYDTSYYFTLTKIPHKKDTQLDGKWTGIFQNYYEEIVFKAIIGYNTIYVWNASSLDYGYGGVYTKTANQFIFPEDSQWDYYLRGDSLFISGFLNDNATLELKRDK